MADRLNQTLLIYAVLVVHAFARCMFSTVRATPVVAPKEWRPPVVSTRGSRTQAQNRI